MSWNRTVSKGEKTRRNRLYALPFIVVATDDCA